MWDLIVSVPDHCLSFYFSKMCLMKFGYCASIKRSIVMLGKENLYF